MAELRLLRGQTALIDDEDLPKTVGYRWLLSTKGYVIARIWNGSQCSTLWLHRLILGTPKGFDTDHKDRNKLNNQKSNLRVAARRQNSGNKRIDKAGHSSRFKGVHRHTNGKWRARFGFRLPDGKRKFVHLGLFDQELDAARAYDQYAVKHFGEDFALLNT